MIHFTESTLEETALAWLRDLGYSIVFGGKVLVKDTEEIL
jgi:hypothetical protein